MNTQTKTNDMKKEYDMKPIEDFADSTIEKLRALLTNPVQETSTPKNV